MNKQLLIVLLAVCLVSTHAFVKREAALPTLEDVNSQFDITKTKIDELISQLSEETKKNLDPETLKNNVNNFIDAFSKTIESLKPTTEAPKPAA